MAALEENLLSLGHLIDMERNTFRKQREHSLKKSVDRPMLLQADFSNNLVASSSTMHLLQRWQELKDRELRAQQHNKQLLQQFEEAQGVLREMLTLAADMKTIRMEYERYLEESSPCRQHQLKTTQAAQRKDPISSHPFQLHSLGSMPNHHHPWPRQNPTGKASLHPDQACTWTAGTSGIPSGSEADVGGQNNTPPARNSWQARTEPPGHPASPGPQGAPSQPPPENSARSNPRKGTQEDTGATTPNPWVQLYVQGPHAERGVPQFVGEQAETSSTPSSERERAGGRRSSLLSQELDTKPVRLSSCPAGSSESGRESSQVCRERRKHREKRGRSRRTSSDRERRSSQDLSQNSSVIVTAAITPVQSSESGVSSEESRTSIRGRKSTGHVVGLQGVEKAATKRTRNKNSNSGSHKEERQSSSEESRSEKAGDQSHDNNSEGWREESGRKSSVKMKNGGEDLSSCFEESSGERDEEKEHEKCSGEGDEDTDSDDNEDSKTGDEGEERDVEDDSERNTTTEEEETGAEEEKEEQESEEECDQDKKSDRLKNERQGSASSQDEEVDEDESETSEDEMEEDGESALGSVKTGGEEQKRDEAGQEKESDPEDSIISPQSKKLHVIPEEAREDEDEEEGSKSGNSDEDSNEFSDDDIEHLLAPPEQSQKKEEKDLNADEKPKAFCDKLEIFQVETDRSTDHSSDSEEFDHFYD